MKRITLALLITGATLVNQTTFSKGTTKERTKTSRMTQKIMKRESDAKFVKGLNGVYHRDRLPAIKNRIAIWNSLSTKKRKKRIQNLINHVTKPSNDNVGETRAVIGWLLEMKQQGFTVNIPESK